MLPQQQELADHVIWAQLSSETGPAQACGLPGPHAWCVTRGRLNRQPLLPSPGVHAAERRAGSVAVCCRCWQPVRHELTVGENAGATITCETVMLDAQAADSCECQLQGTAVCQRDAWPPSRARCMPLQRIRATAPAARNPHDAAAQHRQGATAMCCCSCCGRPTRELRQWAGGPRRWWQRGWGW